MAVCRSSFAIRFPYRCFLMTPFRLVRALAVASALMFPYAAAQAATACGTGNFDAWLADFKTEAASKGISKAAIDNGLAGVTLDKSVINRDKSQKVFSQSFEEFSGRM